MQRSSKLNLPWFYIHIWCGFTRESQIKDHVLVLKVKKFVFQFLKLILKSQHNFPLTTSNIKQFPTSNQFNYNYFSLITSIFNYNTLASHLHLCISNYFHSSTSQINSQRLFRKVISNEIIIILLINHIKALFTVCVCSF